MLSRAYFKDLIQTNRDERVANCYHVLDSCNLEINPGEIDKVGKN